MIVAALESAVTYPHAEPSTPPSSDPWPEAPVSPYEMVVQQPPHVTIAPTVAPHITNHIDVHVRVPRRRRPRKDLGRAYGWWMLGGVIGAHHYYLGRTGKGVLYTLTFGIFLFGWLIDGVTLPTQVRQVNNRGW